METAQIAKLAFLAISVSVAALVFPVNTRAASGNVQYCQPDTSCTIGEFLYNDSYTPITDATCNITSRYPDGTLLLNSVAMTSAVQGDGWYSHTFTAPATLGLYRTEVKCTTSGETLALDKSFEVKAESSLTSGDVTSAVWGVSRTSNNSAGTFGEVFQNSAPSANDVAVSVWGYSNRTLSTFGTLVADIWNYTTRTLTGSGLSSGSLATQGDVSAVKDEVVNSKSDLSSVKSDVASIKSTVNGLSTSTTTVINNNTQNIQNFNETRNLLEQIVNRPVIENGLEGDENETTIDLQSKIEKSASFASQMVVNTNYSKSKISLIELKWNNLESNQIKSSVTAISALIGDENDNQDKNSLFGYVNWFQKQWDLPAAKKLYTQNKKLKEQLSTLEQNLSVLDRSKSKVKTQEIVASLNGVIKLVGSQSDPNSLMGQIESKKQLSLELDQNQKDINALLAGWSYDPKSPKSKADESIVNQVVKISEKVAQLNRIPKISNLLSVKPEKLSEKDLRNKALDLRGVVDVNKQYLVLNPTKPFSSFWLGEGSIVFKTLITNPSNKISQEVPLKYYLPKEVTKESIIKVDESLTVTYDIEKDQYYVKGQYNLGPGESKTIQVSVDDSIFQISDQKIATMRKQTDTLSKPLNNTSYFAQGVTLKSDIEAALDRVEALQKEGVTPEAKIKAFRDAQIEYKTAEQKLDKLKELATSAGSVGSLFGFVGGAQALAVWGLIIMMASGFVFLALYMKTLRNGELHSDGEKQEVGLHHVKHVSRPALYAVIILTLGLVGFSTFRVFSNTTNPQEISESKPTKQDVVLGVNTEPEDESPGTDVTVFVPIDNNVDVFADSSLVSPVLDSFSGSKEVKEINRINGWVKISFEGKEGKIIKGWVDQDFVENNDSNRPETKPEANASVLQSLVTVINTPTDFLRVRLSPGGKEITMLNPGDKLPLIKRQSGWAQVQLDDGSLGWVSEKYLTLNTLPGSTE